VTDWLRHQLGRPCLQRVTGHAFVPAEHPAWGGYKGCIWLTHPQANRCSLPERCHG
jgi:hypothetical protein